MPRLPVDGRRVKEHRITLGSYERKLLDDIALSYRIQAFDQRAILEVLKSTKSLIDVMYSIATIFEILGIETGLPTVADIPEVVQWLQEKAIKADSPISETNPSIWTLLNQFWSGEIGGYPGGY